MSVFPIAEIFSILPCKKQMTGDKLLPSVFHSYVQSTRPFMLFNPIIIVETLCAIADVVGCIIPVIPSRISPELIPQSEYHPFVSFPSVRG